MGCLRSERLVDQSRKLGGEELKCSLGVKYKLDLDVCP